MKYSELTNRYYHVTSYGNLLSIMKSGAILPKSVHVIDGEDTNVICLSDDYNFALEYCDSVLDAEYNMEKFKENYMRQPVILVLNINATKLKDHWLLGDEYEDNEFYVDKEIPISAITEIVMSDALNNVLSSNANMLKFNIKNDKNIVSYNI